MSSGDLSEAEWRLLEPLLPPERGRKSRPAFDNRQIVNGIHLCDLRWASFRSIGHLEKLWPSISCHGIASE